MQRERWTSCPLIFDQLILQEPIGCQPDGPPPHTGSPPAPPLSHIKVESKFKNKLCRFKVCRVLTLKKVTELKVRVCPHKPHERENRQITDDGTIRPVHTDHEDPPQSSSVSPESSAAGNLRCILDFQSKFQSLFP